MPADLFIVIARFEEVFPEVDFDTVDAVTGRENSLTKEFGPFSVTV